MRSFVRFNKQEIEWLKNNYPLLGSKYCAKKLGKNRNMHDIRNVCYRNNIKKVITKKTKYCAHCKKKIGAYGKSIICRSCSARINLLNRYKHDYKNNFGIFWKKEEIEYLKKNYWISEKKDIKNNLNRTWSSIKHKANRLKIKRNLNYFRARETRKFNIRDNPSKRPGASERLSIRMKEYLRKNPDKMLNRRLKRNHITSLEKAVKRILNKHNIDFKYNHYVKTKDSYKFPDFRVGKLIIECDGARFHKDKEKETKRDRELIEAGYCLLHFSQGKICHNIGIVEKCILKKLNQLGILEKSKLMI